MVWYFIGVYIINRTLHGHLEIRNFSSRVENISLVRCAHSWNIFQHSKINFVSPCCHVIIILYLFNKSAFFNCPFLNILLAKSRHGVMYNYYFFSHGWLHITPSILLPDTTLMENDWVWLAIASEVQRQPLK